jgi:hypothetical protein
MVLMAPTVIADGALPGGGDAAVAHQLVSGLVPKLPADTTTTMPARTVASTAWTSGSVWADS